MCINHECAAEFANRYINDGNKERYNGMQNILEQSARGSLKFPMFVVVIAFVFF